MRRILLAIAGYAIAAWWNNRGNSRSGRDVAANDAPQKASRRSSQLQGHAGARKRPRDA